jgi:phenylacetate-CoA ligase
MDLSARIEKIYFDLLIHSQYWSADEMQAYQHEHLTKSLNHTRSYVPFFKNRMDAVFNHDGSINWNRWRDIPFLKRQDLIDHREAMQATHMLPEFGQIATFSSSGTAEVPVATRHSALATWANRAAIIYI